MTFAPASTADIVLLSACSFLGNVGKAVTGFGMAIVFLFVWNVVEVFGYDGDFKYAVFIQSLALFCIQPLALYNAQVIKNAYRDILLLFIPITLISTPLGQLLNEFVPTKTIQAVAGVLVALVALWEFYTKRNWFLSLCKKKVEKGGESAAKAGKEVSPEGDGDNKKIIDEFEDNPPDKPGVGSTDPSNQIDVEAPPTDGPDLEAANKSNQTDSETETKIITTTSLDSIGNGSLQEDSDEFLSLPGSSLSGSDAFLGDIFFDDGNGNVESVETSNLPPSQNDNSGQTSGRSVRFKDDTAPSQNDNSGQTSGRSVRFKDDTDINSSRDSSNIRAKSEVSEKQCSDVKDRQLIESLQSEVSALRAQLEASQKQKRNLERQIYTSEHQMTPSSTGQSTAFGIHRSAIDESDEGEFKIGVNKATFSTLFAGGASGFLGGLVAIRGPPLILYFLHPPKPVSFNKNTQRATASTITFFNVFMRQCFYLYNTFAGSGQIGYQKEEW
eukprot:CAMPEP_0183743290 /NCGR_PEP_ID=MMETSP0737-20130205/65142_1 /TAXON_ID=385413 /ORGANISM="Thalassiosira miniscula, Strain CCMP1093" /LENGTH=498 /DNA_ID=CAMNT_0025978901 /DNA_START=159 /DNA_END=1652 /DNA_ORIENTATION=+